MKKLAAYTLVGLILTGFVLTFCQSFKKVSANPYRVFSKLVNNAQYKAFEKEFDLDQDALGLHSLALREARFSWSPITTLEKANLLWEWHGSSDYYTLPIVVRVTSQSMVHQYLIVPGTVQFVKDAAAQAEVRLVVYDFPTYGAPRRVDDKGKVSQLVNGVWVDDNDQSSSKQIRMEARHALMASL